MHVFKKKINKTLEKINKKRLKNVRKRKNVTKILKNVKNVFHIYGIALRCYLKKPSNCRCFNSADMRVINNYCVLSVNLGPSIIITKQIKFTFCHTIILVTTKQTICQSKQS